MNLLYKYNECFDIKEAFFYQLFAITLIIGLMSGGIVLGATVKVGGLTSHPENKWMLKGLLRTNNLKNRVKPNPVI